MVGHFSHDLSRGSGLNKSIQTHSGKNIKEFKVYLGGRGHLYKRYKKIFYEIPNIAKTSLAYKSFFSICVWVNSFKGLIILRSEAQT